MSGLIILVILWVLYTIALGKFLFYIFDLPPIHLFDVNSTGMCAGFVLAAVHFASIVSRNRKNYAEYYLEGVVITAEIPVGAIVFCINGSKCRTNRAKITDMAGHDVLHSKYDNTLEYRIGQEIEIKEFNLMYNIECASGFHFFRTREEAEKY